jgi:capsular polysaccharide export protein
MRVRDLLYILNFSRRLAIATRNRVDRFTRRSVPRKNLSRLNDGALAFFNRRTPTGDKYPYEVHFAPALQNAPAGVEAFHLVGRAWRKTPQAPLALAFGFNAWKYGFMANYCPDVRIAFAPRKFLGWGARRAAKSMQPAPSRIYVWGYTDPSWLAAFARKRGIPLIRVEDGFLRSAELGASHATPYSLVFDSKGLYYNTGEPNDLADILRTHDFENDAELMRDARDALELMIEKRLSKYNMPDISDPARHFSVKTRRRVLVLGQVDNDAAVRMGNPHGWRMNDIVRLARLENPDAEVLYRPHPEVFKGYQRSRLRAEQIEKFARVVSPDGPLIDLFDTVDQVYTISSLSGLEALLRNVSVTTLGTPFYAGWGLTDDRTQDTKGRKLTVLELFAGVYLKHPRYLADIEDSFDGLKVAALRILGEKKQLSINSFTQNDPSTEEHGAKNFAHLSAPAALAIVARSTGSNSGATNEQFHRSIPLEKIATFSKGQYYHRCAAAIILGYARLNLNLPNTIESLVNALDETAILDVLSIFHSIASESERNIIESVFAESLSKSGFFQESSSLFKQIKKKYRDFQSDSPEDILIGETENIVEEPILEILSHELNHHIRIANKLEAERIAIILILSSFKTIDTIENYYSISYSQFDLISAHAIAQITLHCETPAVVKRALAMICQTIPFDNLDAFATWQALNILHSPSMVSGLLVPLKQYENQEAIASISNNLIRTIDVDGRASISKVQALIGIGRADAALETAESLFRLSNPSPQMIVVYSQALGATMRYKEALYEIERALTVWPVSLVYREALRLCILLGDYKKGLEIYRNATEKRIDLGDMVHRKIMFGNGEVESAFRTFLDLRVRKTVAHHFHDHYYKDDLNSIEEGTVFLAAIFGPGDEIRFASIYSDIRNKLHDKANLIIGCDPRLLDLFSRSFQNVEFIPVKRLRGSDAFRIEDYDRVRHPGNRLALDNNAVTQILASDKFAFVSDFLHECRKTKEDFPSSPYLIADKAISYQISQRIPSDELIVGISWRSSLNTYSRNEHYLSIEEIAPLFEIEGIRFINLQYDDCTAELELIQRDFPGRLVDLDFIDQYNDLDSVASLMSCLDLVISPATTVVELAGALGCPTWLLSNSSELHWRKKSGQTDVWHSSVSHIEGDQLGDKESLVTNLVAALIEWRDARNAEA